MRCCYSDVCISLPQIAGCVEFTAETPKLKLQVQNQFDEPELAVKLMATERNSPFE